MQEERRRILAMLAQGRLTPEEAERQLEALQRNAQRPVIDVGPEAGPRPRWERYSRHWEAWQIRLRDRRNWPTYVLFAPLAVILVVSAIGLVLLLLLGVLGLWLAVPALVIFGVWNGLLAPLMPGLPPLGWVQAFFIAFVIVFLVQGRKRWQP